MGRRHAVRPHRAPIAQQAQARAIRKAPNVFVNRDRELTFLNSRYATHQAELVVLYGRRRLGKTELLRTFCQDKPHLFYVADLGTEEAQLADFTRQAAALIAGDSNLLAPFASWEAAFAFLLSQRLERLVVVLDEVDCLVDVNPALPSVLQRLWDERLRQSQLMLVLCGSYVSMIEREVLAYRSPLYGRRTGQWRLQPLSFWDAHQLLPGFPPADSVRAYAVLGGVPAYLRQFDDSRPLLENIERRILALGEFLHDEPRFLLLQELREPHRYFAVLDAIAGGRTRLNEIAQITHIAVTSVTFYLKTLQEMGLVARVTPVTERNPDKSRWGLYQLTDPYFRFWFRFVYPQRSLLERGETRSVRRQVAEMLDQFTGPAFEAICREWVWREYAAGGLGFTPTTVGSWWDRQCEIDVAAVGVDAAGEAVTFVGQCIWSDRPVDVNVLDDLKRKAARMAKSTTARVSHVLCSRGGFTEALTRRAAAEGVRLVGLDELVG